MNNLMKDVLVNYVSVLLVFHERLGYQRINKWVVSTSLLISPSPCTHHMQ